MIDRYSRKEMREIWSERKKFQTYLDIEILNAEALAALDIVPSNELELIQKNARFDIKQIEILEEQTKHDVIAFTRCVSESLGEEKRWIHYGLTSTDIVDTANGVRFKEANDIIANDLIQFMDTLKQKAILYKNTYCIGRTHGMHAEVTVFGLKYTLWYEDMKRNLERFELARKTVEIGKISGAVGNYSFVDPFVEQYVCQKLGINAATISTQTLQRDRYAFYIEVLALIAASLEKIATEIRHLQRTEVGEVSESFVASQKGSSAMPHKHNPISSENICGLSRIVRSYVTPAIEDIALWHERDISHSSVERIVFPDITCLIDYMLTRYQNTLSTLIVYEDQMQRNIMTTNGTIYSQRVLSELIKRNFSREKAYDLVQTAANISIASKRPFLEILKNNDMIKITFSQSEIEQFFDNSFYSKNVDMIYKKVFEG